MSDEVKPKAKVPQPAHLTKARLDRGGKMGNSSKGKATVRKGESQTTRLQALQIIQKRVEGKSLNKIGGEMNLSPDTVKRRIAYAQKEGLFQAAEDRVLNDLVPLAIKAFQGALENGMYEAARDVLFGTGLLSKNANRAAEQVELTLASWRDQRKATLNVTTNKTSGAAERIAELFAGAAESVSESVGEDSDGDGLSPVDWIEAAPDPNEDV